MRKALALLAALSLSASGCALSSIDPDASVRVSGRALDASGRPLAGARVLLFKQADIGEVVFGGVLAVGSLSTVCLLPDPPAICRKASTATADSEGRYRFDLEGSDTQGTLGTESTLNIVFAGSGGRTSTTVSFTAEEEEISLPDARLWNARPRVAQGPGRIRLSWSRLPATGGRDAAYSTQLFAARGGPAVWTEAASAGEAELDPRLLEGRAGSVAAGALTELSGGSGAGEVRASYLSRRLPVRATSGPPPSRGRRCAAVTGTAPAVRGAFSACGATDGDLDQPARLSGRGDAVVVGVVIDLGGARSVDLAVARGLAGQVVLELSDDGRSFRTAATGSGPALALRPTGATTARFVRLRSPSGLDQSLMAEVSVW